MAFLEYGILAFVSYIAWIIASAVARATLDLSAGATVALLAAPIVAVLLVALACTAWGALVDRAHARLENMTGPAVATYRPGGPGGLGTITVTGARGPRLVGRLRPHRSWPDKQVTGRTDVTWNTAAYAHNTCSEDSGPTTAVTVTGTGARAAVRGAGAGTVRAYDQAINALSRAAFMASWPYRDHPGEADRPDAWLHHVLAETARLVPRAADEHPGLQAARDLLASVIPAAIMRADDHAGDLRVDWAGLTAGQRELVAAACSPAGGLTPRAAIDQVAAVRANASKMTS